jgi:uncharacterized protein YndB with AHSA1/START domain
MARGYAQFVEIQVPPEVTWAAFTEEHWLRRWYAPHVELDPRAGGELRVRLRDGRVREAAIDVWMPGRRLRLIYFPEAEFTAPGDPTAAGGGPVIEDVLFDTRPGRSVVRVMGSGVPDARALDRYYTRARLGWAFHLNELKRALEASFDPTGSARPATGTAR